jgi:hypothetical protein
MMGVVVPIMHMIRNTCYCNLQYYISGAGRCLSGGTSPPQGLCLLYSLLLKDIFTHYEPEVTNPTVILHACKRSLFG